jgi:Fic family protein
MIYKPGALPGKLVQFFEDNPDEELTLQIAVIKFNASPVAVQTAISRLVEAGVLESIKVIRLPAKGRASVHAYDLGAE